MSLRATLHSRDLATSSKVFDKRNTSNNKHMKRYCRQKITYLVLIMLTMASCQSQKSSSNENNDKTKTDELESVFDLFNSEEYDKFIELVEPEWKSNKEKTGLLIPLSYAYAYIENPEKALFYSNEMLKREPENFQALFVKAGCYLHLDKIDSAEFIYKKVIDINPFYARANLNLAQVYLIKGDKKNAISQYMLAIELFHENNFKEEVILYSKKVLDIDPNNDKAKRFIEEYN